MANPNGEDLDRELQDDTEAEADLKRRIDGEADETLPKPKKIDHASDGGVI
jgi:hypothetical protein